MGCSYDHTRSDYIYPSILQNMNMAFIGIINGKVISQTSDHFQ